MVAPIRVGTASVNWGFDPLYTWVKLPSFSRMLNEMASAGYAGTEISYHFPTDVNLLRKELTGRSLGAAASFVALDLRDPARHEEALRTITPVAQRLAALGSNTIVLSDKPSRERIEVAGRVSESDRLDWARWTAMCEGLNHAGEYLASLGMQTVFHPHVGTYVETRSEIDRLCASTNPALVGLCPDTGHLAYAGVRPEEIFADYASRIKYVHLKDVDAGKLEAVRAGGIDFVNAVRMGLFVELGTGMAGIGRIIEHLQSADYAGWLIVEQDAPANPLESARRNRRYLLEECGI
jgi:inosose dehydratase